MLSLKLISELYQIWKRPRSLKSWCFMLDEFKYFRVLVFICLFFCKFHHIKRMMHLLHILHQPNLRNIPFSLSWKSSVLVSKHFICLNDWRYVIKILSELNEVLRNLFSWGLVLRNTFWMLITRFINTLGQLCKVEVLKLFNGFILT